MNPTSSTNITNTQRPAFRSAFSWLENKLSKAGISQISIQFDGRTSFEIGERKSGIPLPTLHIHQPMSLIRQSSNGLLGWAEAYLNGDWSTPDLKALTDWAMHNEQPLEQLLSSSLFSRLFNRLLHKLRRNSKAGSRRNIAAHYDLGNDFYRQWLDDSMTYSSALYLDKDDSLETAQHNKYNQILNWLQLKDDQSVLEIGCGWGGFAQSIGERHRGYHGHYQGVTLSTEQLAYAQEASSHPSQHFSLTDYRDIEGQFDHIVSIEMIEAVGEEHWPIYFNKLYNSLKPGGTAVIQAILIDDSRFEEYRSGVDFIQRYIFPGGMLPTDSIIEQQSANAGLQIMDRLSFGQDYGRTLDEWKQRFLAAWPSIEPLGFDERFKRMWEFYLAYCETGFQFKSIDVCLYKLTRPLEEAGL
ncbi:cyclopropane-fatty-acyl-phospholipid synthase family protein [uncultured Endozoicomonas sp.]|uniref:SAM-dependent methyltransferase n=1 Tax=uncultured Endozoicomonas sp. TaxID=432652 RepID=UPI00261C96CC|nr:cyclopropane-fatty-acyl-phospholipid synthase family protein [uncultured Endozoicomonas sp.]